MGLFQKEIWDYAISRRKKSPTFDQNIAYNWEWCLKTTAFLTILSHFCIGQQKVGQNHFPPLLAVYALQSNFEPDIRAISSQKMLIKAAILFKLSLTISILSHFASFLDLCEF